MHQAASNDPLIGAKVGNYEVRHKLGEGGMGSVYLAEHPLIGKKVALKVLHSEFAANQDVISRFFTEAKAVNDIQHPNIVDIIDYGTIQQADGSTMVYFIMEFLAGTSLATLIRTESPLAPERALRICIQIADALGASHRNNIVHRDLKPDNVILIKRRHEPNFVKVLDFGIAKLTGDQPGSRRTRTGIVMGTPAYMSPEQCEGRGEVDHRTDVYALGILLYEMLTGKVPFEGEGYGEVLVQHLTQPPTPPSTIRGVIPPHVESVCLRALEKRPDDRYPSMEEFMRALSDPVGYVQAAGGPEHFTSANLGAPQMTPYPNVPMTPLTPLPGQISPLSPTPMTPMPMPMPMPMQQQSWPTPVPGANTVAPTPSKTPLVIGAVLVIVALGVGGFFIMNKKSSKGGGGDDDGTGLALGSGSDDGTGEGTGEGTAAGTGAGTAAGSNIPEITPPQPIDAGVVPIDAPPKPVIIKIRIESRPRGAEIYKVGDSKPIGKTPFTWKLDKSDESVEMMLKRRGYKDLPFKTELSVNTKLDLRMEKERRGDSGNSNNSNNSNNGKGNGSGSGKTGDPDNTMNPFD